MKNIVVASILFHCPQCNANFEFDAVGVNEFVACPDCGANHVTVRTGSRLMLQALEQALMC
jgi:lysine biosynthesis protein LysW